MIEKLVSRKRERELHGDKKSSPFPPRTQCFVPIAASTAVILLIWYYRGYRGNVDAHIHNSRADSHWHYLVPFLWFDLKLWPLEVTRGHFWPFQITGMTSYITSFDTFSLSSTNFDKFDFKHFRFQLWPSTFWGHLRSKMCLPFEIQ